MDCSSIFKKAREASGELVSLDVLSINRILMALAAALEEKMPVILAENNKDLNLMDISDPRHDRLKLTRDRLIGIAADIRNVAGLPSPLGKILSETRRPNGLVITRESVPFGVIGIIYEARPNVTFDVFSLCLKSGNACILKGGSDAVNSNTSIVALIKEVLKENGMNTNIVSLLKPDRDETRQLLNARGFVDLIIPRGSQDLIDFVRKNATIPVIETGAGICHTYFDKHGDKEKGRVIINNAKTRRVSVCNALDCLVIHESRLADLEYLVSLCAGSDVIIYADESAYKALKGKYPDKLLERATGKSFGTEFLSYKMSVRTVSGIDEALDHIAKYSSRHSEAIISEDLPTLNTFCQMVDAAAVFTNTSTAFTDGAEFGLGAEIGISTQKLHARGPMALEALTTCKWIVKGNGQVRP
jgi:glutamate-5-semialdehyde dehydrogenase